MPNPGHNRLLKIQPSRIAVAYNEAGVAQYSATLAGASTVERDDDFTDPATGLPMLKLTVPLGEAGANEIQWNNFTTSVDVQNDDVWMFTFWVDDTLSSATVSTLKCTLRLSQLGQSPLGTSFRDFPFTALSIRPGLNVLTVKNTELKYDATAMQILKAAGYRLARGGNGRFHNSWIPGAGQYCFGALSTEAANPWQTDAALNGCIQRGQAMFTYMHTTVAGGAGVNSSPGGAQHYADHLRRWCELVAAHEQAGRAECMTYLDYFRAVGIDPNVDNFI